MLLRTFIFLCILFTGAHAFSQSTSSRRIIKIVTETPYIYEYPGKITLNGSIVVHKPWVVYSDRNTNTVFSDKTLSKSVTSVSFLDSFYVINTYGEAIELIRYRNVKLTAVNKITDSDKIEYIGWMDRSHLLLSSVSMLNAKNALPLKYVTMMHGTQVFESFQTYGSDASMKLYSDPELRTLLPGSGIALSEIVYVYKQIGDKVLIGKSTSVKTSTIASIMQGWIPANAVQCWGTGLCIEPANIPAGDSTYRYIFQSKNQAVNAAGNMSIALPMKSNVCDLWKHNFNKQPVLGKERYLFNNSTYTIFQTGTVIQPFDNSHAFVYASNAAVIPYEALCELEAGSTKVNIVFIMNMNTDAPEYVQTLSAAIQNMETFFARKQGSKIFSFGVVNCSDMVPMKPTLVSSFEEVLPKMLSIVKDAVQYKKSAPTDGIQKGLSCATSVFKDCSMETNIAVIIGSQGDPAYSDDSYTLKQSSLLTDLSMTHTRLLFFQPYSNNGTGYASFVQQSKKMLNASSTKAQQIHASMDIHPNDVNYGHTFRNLDAMGINLYCLDYPSAAATQGFLVFPTIGSKTNGIHLQTALDSLLIQASMEQQIRITAIRSAFNSSAVFQSKTDKGFERYYHLSESMPAHPQVKCRYYNFPYFAEGYCMSPAVAYNPVRYYTQSMLLSAPEYEELYQVFKSLKIDLLAQGNSEANREVCYEAFRKALNRSSRRTGRSFNRNITLADFFYELCGYTVSDPLLSKFYIKQFTGHMYLTKEEFRLMIERMHKAFAAFYAIRDEGRYFFESNGERYYWAEEGMLP